MIHYVFNIILDFVWQYGPLHYTQYDVASVLEDDIDLTVRVDHPKGVGIVANAYNCNSATYNAYCTMIYSYYPRSSWPSTILDMMCCLVSI